MKIEPSPTILGPGDPILKYKTLLVFAFTFILTEAAQATPVFSRKPVAWVYAGFGVCDGCPQSLSANLRRAGFKTIDVGPGDFTAENLTPEKVALFAVPGGDQESDVMYALHPGEAAQIKSYVEAGGHYLGVCLGAFLAAKSMIDVPGGGAPGLDLYDGRVFNHADNKDAKIIDVNWRGNHRWMYFQDGPHFTLTHPETADIWAYYTDGEPQIAAFQAPLGKGRVGLIGPHAEADKEWWNEDPSHVLYDPDGFDFHLLNEFAQTLIQK